MQLTAVFNIFMSQQYSISINKVIPKFMSSVCYYMKGDYLVRKTEYSILCTLQRRNKVHFLGEYREEGVLREFQNYLNSKFFMCFSVCD